MWLPAPQQRLTDDGWWGRAQTRGEKQSKRAIEDRDWEIVRVKNRFHTPLINEGRHILVSIRMRSADSPNLWHICELQASHV